MAAPTTIPTGKNNMLASLRDYLTTQLSPAVVSFESYENVEAVPSICFQDMGVPNLGGHAFEDFVGDQVDLVTGVHTPVFGKKAQTNLEFNILTNQSEDTAAIKDLFTMRDRLEYAFMYSGRTDDAGAVIMPRIALLNYDVVGNPDTGATIWCPMEKDSIWIENYVGQDSERPQLKRLRILVRVFWHLLRP